jgi:hypothetical protein
MIQCLYIRGIELSEEIAIALVKVVLRMCRNNEKKRKIQSNTVSGVIKTEYVYGMLGPMAHGYVFEAEFESAGGRAEIGILLDPLVMEQAKKEDEIPLEFKDIRYRFSQNPSMN